MDRAAADRVRQIREYLSKMTPDLFYQELSDAYTHIVRSNLKPGGIIASFGQDHTGASENNARGFAALRTDAEWLLSQLSASEERVKWIPCLISYPERDREVLVYTVRSNMFNAFWHATADGEERWALKQGGHIQRIDVTHWMPLPAPPVPSQAVEEKK